MSINCLICGKEFLKLISNTHLKTHNMSTKEYIDKFGRESLTSEEYRRDRSEKTKGVNNPNFGNKMSHESKIAISEKNTGKVAWNAGVKFTDTTVQKNAAKRREERYKNGELSRAEIMHTLETKQKISESLKQYAVDNSHLLSERAHKAIETKRALGRNLAFFKGKNHTEESKNIISEKSKEHNKIKIEKSRHDMLVRIERANLTLIDGFDNDYLNLKCNKCNSYFSHTHQMFQPSKYNSEICSTCYPKQTKRSTAEIELFDYIKELCTDSIPSYRYGIKSEIDIFIPSLNIGVEYNGLYWHSEKVLEYNGRHKLSDYNKYLKMIENSIRPIIIFEDEWQNKKNIVKSRLKHILKQVKNTIYARKCNIKEIDSKTAAEFCEKHHIQGKARSNYRIGLFHNTTLTAVMTFSKSNISRNIHEWELNRFCSIPDVSIVGGASKLFKYFIDNINPETVVTYADRRWSDGNLYKAIGFIFDKFTTPGYWYFYPNEVHRHHRYSLRKNDKDEAGLTEWENRSRQGWNRIWDCGNSKWIWKKKS